MTQLVEQGTAEWLAQRCGKITASRFSLPLKKPRAKSAVWSEAAITYAHELVAERLTGQAAISVGSAATAWGNDHEEAGRTAYEHLTGNVVDLAPFVEHALFSVVGGSPDGWVGDDGGAEIKCPYTSRVHVQTLLSGEMPAEHKPQVQGLLWVTGRDWWDFVSYDPRMPEPQRVFVRRVERDAEYIEQLAERIEAFASYVAELEAEVRG